MKKHEYPYGIIASVTNAEKSRNAVSIDELSGLDTEACSSSSDAQAERMRRQVTMIADTLIM
jgi:hypothetical protein